MHAPMDPKDIILMLAMTEDGNPLGDLPENPDSIPFSVFTKWVEFWMGLITAQLEKTSCQVGLEDLAEIMYGEGNPLMMLPEYEEYKAANPPPDMTVPMPVFEEFVTWYADEIAKYIEKKQQGGNV